MYTSSVLYFFVVDVKGSGALSLLGTLIHQLLIKFDDDRRVISIVEQFTRKFTEPSEDSLVTLLMELSTTVGVL
jgi:hypothetical protein